MKKGQGKFNLERNIKIRSGVEVIRDLKAPKEINGENVLMHEQAAYDAGNLARSTWKMGFLYLTKKKMVFFQEQNRILEISLDSLNKIAVVDRNWIPGKMVEQLRLTREEDGIKRVFHLSVKNTGQWKEIIEAIKQKTKKREE